MATKTTISVALCTCNGEKYIEEQLLSILQQDVSVDEIVVSDDLSTDSTLDIVRNIASKASIPIRILTNDTSSHYGVCANFEKAINATTGDIIFFSDQDDVWLPYKTKIISDWFEHHVDKQLVFTDAFLIDEKGIRFVDNEGKELSIVSNLRTSDNVLEQLCESIYMLEVFLNGNICTGATMAARRTFIAGLPLLQLGEGKLHHDAIVALLGIDRQTIGYCSKKTIEYRLHSKQVCGMPIHKNHTRMRQIRHFLPPVGSYLTCVNYDVWPIFANTQQRIHFYNERYKLINVKYQWGGVKRYYRIYGDLYLWQVDIRYGLLRYFKKILVYIKKK